MPLGGENCKSCKYWYFVYVVDAYLHCWSFTHKKVIKKVNSFSRKITKSFILEKYDLGLELQVGIHFERYTANILSIKVVENVTGS